MSRSKSGFFVEGGGNLLVSTSAARVSAAKARAKNIIVKTVAANRKLKRVITNEVDWTPA